MGFGNFLKRVTTPHRALRPLLGRSVLDEVGTVGGFLVGGPTGAAIGRGAGKGLATGNVGKAIGGAVEGYALGSAASAAGLKGGSSSLGKILMGSGGGAPGAVAGDKAAYLAAKGLPVGGSSTPAAPGNGFSLGRLLGGMDNYFTDPERGDKRLDMLTTGLGAAATVYGANQGGKMEDRRFGLERDQWEWNKQQVEREWQDMMRRRQLLMDLYQQYRGGAPLNVPYGTGGFDPMDEEGGQLVPPPLPMQALRR